MLNYYVIGQIGSQVHKEREKKQYRKAGIKTRKPRNLPHNQSQKKLIFSTANLCLKTKSLYEIL